MDFFSLKIKNVTPETLDTVTLEFEVPADLQEKFAYKQGQHITVRIQKDGHELRRSYSMSSSPLEKGRLAVTVKKVRGGEVSVFLHDSVKAGDTLEIGAPDGRFFTPLDPEKRRTYYLFGAGSGITPLMSILKTTLEAEPMSSIFLLYGSRDEESIIFRDELERLTERYTGQLQVEHVLSQPKKESAGGGGLFGIFKKTTTNWQGKIGRITQKLANEFLDENFPRGPESDCHYFVCGPGNMTDSVKIALLGRGIEAKQIHTEHFVNASHVPGEFSAASEGKRVIVHLQGKKFDITVPPGATILDVLVKGKYDPPYSCTAGACSTCMAKLLSGKVNMEVCYALDDEEVKAGYVLTCQSHPETEVVELTYDM